MSAGNPRLAWRTRSALAALGLAVAVAASLVAFAVWRSNQPVTRHQLEELPPEAPPELAKNRTEFLEGLAAIEGGDGRRAAELLSSFTFGSRPVEQYRLYHLATAQQLAGEPDEARRTLARLWRGGADLAYATDVGYNLGTLYASRGANARAAEIFSSLALRVDGEARAAPARAESMRARFRAGDVGGAMQAALALVVEHPASPDAKEAEAVLAALGGAPLTDRQKIARASALLAAGHPRDAMASVAALEVESLPQSLANELRLFRGRALARLGALENSDEMLEPLFSGPYRFAIPALELSAANRRALALAINPVEYRTVKVRERAGTRVVTRKGKKVRVPRYRTVNRREERVNLQKKAKREQHEAVYRERLNDLRSLPIDEETKVRVLAQLIGLAASKEEYRRVRELVPEMIDLDPSADPALQHFWDKGWEAYRKGDLTTSRDLFNFIASTYRNPNIRRQATYWFARSLERSGQKGQAESIYRELADVAYRDLYAKFAADRLGGQTPPSAPRDAVSRVSWEELAEKEMPDELRLAWELSALGAARDARLEVQRKASLDNRKWADSILGDLYYADKAYDLSYRYLRRAWPELGTVEQSEVPLRFMEMYYPLRYEPEIRAAAQENDLDPYLVMALIRQESAFNPDARSPVGATGLMQIMPATGRELGNRFYQAFSVSRLENPEVNVKLGTYYLKRVIALLEGNEELALAGYNGGPYRIKRWRQEQRGQPLDEFIEGMPLSETRNYVKRITLLRSTYERMYSPQRGG